MSRHTQSRTAAQQTKEGRASGGQHHQVSFRDQWRAYRNHHKATLEDAGRRLVKAPTSTFMTVLVMAIALALPTGLSVLLENAQALTRNWDGNPQVSLFLAKDASDQQQQRLLAKVQQQSTLERVELITREQALKEFEVMSGFAGVIEHLDENPLPPVLVAYPKAADIEVLQQLTAELGKIPGVELAQLDVEWVKRLHSMIDLGQRLLAALIITLGLAVLLVVGNTIRLAIESRRDEIVIVKLVGATDSFVRRPFLYTGFWFGLLAGLVSLLLVQMTLWWLSGPVGELANLYQSDFSLTGLGVATGLWLILGSVLLGVAGGWVAVSSRLRSIEPD